MDSQSLYALVNKGYSGLAAQAVSNEDQNHIAAKNSDIAQAFGYTESELHSLPASANLGLSCGNPLATANLRSGEVVIDLGCGGGIDVILAARKTTTTGPGGTSKGHVYGIDSSSAMLDLARRNASRAGVEVQNATSFIQAPIIAIPLEDDIADCVISNCVINLVPDADKPAVFEEIFRLLKPGGRVAVSDILAKEALPAEIREDVSLYVGCVAGASQVWEYKEWMRKAGFEAVALVDKGSDLNVYKEQGCCTSDKTAASVESGCGSKKSCSGGASGKNAGVAEGGVRELDLNEWVGSYQIYALKPSK